MGTLSSATVVEESRCLRVIEANVHELREFNAACQTKSIPEMAYSPSVEDLLETGERL